MRIAILLIFVLAGPLPARQGVLSATGEANLVALARLSGIIQHFHPSDAAAAADWNAIVTAAVPRVEPLSRRDALVAELRTLADRYAPTALVGTRAEVERGSNRGDADGEVLWWKHRGFGRASFNGGIAESERRRRPAGDAAGPDEPTTGEVVIVELAPELWCSVPLTVDAEATESSAAADPPSLAGPAADARAERLAAVIVAWNALQHFHVYFEEVYVDWCEELRRALRNAAAADGPWTFRAVLNRMLAPLQDGHGGVTVPGATPEWGLPFRWEWIEDQPVITAAGDTTLRRGDVVLALDGVDAITRIREAELAAHGSTPHYRRHRAMIDLTYRRDDRPATLRVRQRDGRIETLIIEPVEVRYWPWAPTVAGLERPPSLTELRPGMLYVDLNTMTEEQFTDALPQLARADSIVFDIRFYPRSMYHPRWIQHVIDEPFEGLGISVPHVPRPDRVGLRHEHAVWRLEPAEPRLTNRIVVLSGRSGLSSCESHVGMALAAGLTVMGEPTGGTNGNVFNLKLPGDVVVSFTGAHVRHADGARLYGVGCVPDRAVHRTIDGVASGEDEILERSIEWLETQP